MGWLTGPEVQPIIIIAGSLAVSRETVLGKELGVLHPNPKAARKTRHPQAARRVPKSTGRVTHFLQQGHTSK